jgi:hypothetical protein
MCDDAVGSNGCGRSDRQVARRDRPVACATLRIAVILGDFQGAQKRLALELQRLMKWNSPKPALDRVCPHLF